MQKYSVSQTYLILELSSPAWYALLLDRFPLVLCWQPLSEENFKFIQTFKLDLLCARFYAKHYEDKALLDEKYCFPKEKKCPFFPHIPIICISECQLANQIASIYRWLLYATAKGTDNYQNYNVLWAGCQPTPIHHIWMTILPARDSENRATVIQTGWFK